MIDSSTVKRLMAQTGITIVGGAVDADEQALERFARACFEAGRQREADRVSEIRERFDAESA